MRPFLVADLFCGAGGSSTGAEKAVRAIGGEMVLVAVNHWPIAIETHQKNHPNSRHYCIDLDAARPEVLVPEGKLDLLMASPECVFFSRARGGKPVSDQRRMSAWHVQRWCTALDVRCVLIENVPEFIDWGPLTAEGKPERSKKGLYFQAWVKTLWELGYEVDFRVLNAADHGDATTRRRFFLQARKDGRPVRWPDPSHRKPGAKSGAMFADDRPTWRAAREIIDWQNAGRSLLDDPRYLKRPLSEKTRRRIARGLAKFGGPLAPLYISLLGLEPVGGTGETVEPFIAVARENNVPRSCAEPLQTITTSPAMFMVKPTVEPFVLGQQSGSAPRVTEEPIPTVAAGGAISLIRPLLSAYNGNGHSSSVDAPMPTQTAKARFGLVEPKAAPFVLSRHSNDLTRSTDEPLPTATGRGAGYLVEPFVLSRFSSGWENAGTPARSVDQPLSTIVGSPGGAGFVVEPFLTPFRGDKEGREPRAHSVDAPLLTITAGGKPAGLVQPFIVPKFGEAPGQDPRVHDLDEPLPTVTSEGAGRLVEPVVVQIAHTQDAGGHVHTVDAPLHTVTARNNLGLARPILKQLHEAGVDPRRVVLVDGVPHLLDIRFRMLTNRELARAMGFDDAEVEYEFVGTVEQVTRQIGNAVPVNLAKALVTSVLAEGAA